MNVFRNSLPELPPPTLEQVRQWERELPMAIEELRKEQGAKSANGRPLIEEYKRELARWRKAVKSRKKLLGKE